MRDTRTEGPKQTRTATVGLRRTRQRTAVLDTLGECADFVSAQDLHTRLTAVGVTVGLSTVYRTLHELERARRVDVVRDESGGRLYRQRPTAGHRHYLVCRCCLRSQPIDTEIVERWAVDIAERSGFTGVEHTLELNGVCDRCRPAVVKGEPPCRQASDHRTDHRTCPS
jgi:Fur family ferric uptake transcriptional regulator